MEYTPQRFEPHSNAESDMFGRSGYSPEKLARMKREHPNEFALAERIVDASPALNAAIKADLLEIAAEITPTVPLNRGIIGYARRLLTRRAECY